MIEKLKSTLLEIRNERDDELQRYKLHCSSNQAYEDRKAILILELPFKTDTLSVHYARASAHEKSDDERNEFLRITGEEVILPEKVLVRSIKNGQEFFCEEKVNVKKRIKKSSKNAHTLIDEWIRSADEATRLGRRTLYNILKKWITNFYVPHPSCKKVLVSTLSSLPADFYVPHLSCKKVLASTPSSLPAEDLPHILTLEVMSATIDALDVEPSAKEVYLSHARSLRAFLEKAYPISPILKSRRSRLSLRDAAKLFEYLEARALKSTTKEKYHDILLCRGLFYAPLPEKELFALGPPDEKLSCLRSDNDVFYVPRSFIRLWKALPCSESLFSRSFDDRQLHKKIQRLGKYAELAIESLTPSILRTTAQAVYSFHLSLSEEVVALLPKRS